MLIDSHCHLDFPQFAQDLPNVLARAEEADVRQMVAISTRIKHFHGVHAIATAHSQVFCSVGTHPHNAEKEQHKDVDDIVALCEHDKVVAIGEAGLDYYYDHAAPVIQARDLRTHIGAARQTGLPLVIHARDADKPMIDILREESEKGVFPFVLHCFSSGLELARCGIELGGYVSFSGILTFKTADALRAIAAALPLERLLVETDAPYLAPAPHRGKTNEPAFVTHTARVLADVRGMAFDSLADATCENFYRLFSKVPRYAS